MFKEEFVKEIDIVNSGFLSRATLNRARHAGLKFYRIGAYICYRREDLGAWFCKPRSWKTATPKGKGEPDEQK
jgi:hypothetical protein